MSRSDFWSRRKAAVAKEEAQAEPPAAFPAEPETGDDDLSDEELLDKYELPDPDSLQEGDDFAAFMSSKVPERLRNRALRKLWLTNPTLANVDGLVEYGEDYTDAATVIENMQTVYQVGKGMIQKILEEDEDEETASDALALSDDPASQADDEVREDEYPTESLEIENPQIEAEPVEIASAQSVEIPAKTPVKPRMRFHFASNG